jgi:Predicted hydrolase of the metallo-beta-lactamase superfamily
MKFLQPNETAITAIGGLGEVGKNMYMLEHKDEIIIIDAGVMFPSDDLLGVEYVIPDLTYLIQNEKKIKALFITHGHEDHIGGIHFLLQKVAIPVIYSAKLGMALIRNKLSNNNVKPDKTKFFEFDESSTFVSKHFNVNFYLTTHSIPDAYALEILTPNGRVVHTGDFKFDFTPVGPQANLAKMAQMGADGVDLLLSDSTNSEVPGFSISEKEVGETLHEMIEDAKGRVIVASFASNVYRVQQIIEYSIAEGRKIAVFGRSMESVVRISQRLGYINSNKNAFVKESALKHLKDNEVTILCTGSQGEALAALSRIAYGTHKQVKIKPSDTVIFSSSPIPGNVTSVNKVINQLCRMGIDVVYGKEKSIHASGHAAQGEQKLMLNLLQPKNFMPIHGEHRMLQIHAETAQRVGIPKENCFIQKNGDVLALNKGRVYPISKIPATDWYVEGNKIGGIGAEIVTERMELSESGFVSVHIQIENGQEKIRVKRPSIHIRGLAMPEHITSLLSTLKTNIHDISDEYFQTNGITSDYAQLKNTIEKLIKNNCLESLNRNPVVITTLSIIHPNNKVYIQ